MTLKELALNAQQALHSRFDVSCDLPRVYELLAAFFGYDSYADFKKDGACLVDKAVENHFRAECASEEEPNWFIEDWCDEVEPDRFYSKQDKQKFLLNPKERVRQRCLKLGCPDKAAALAAAALESFLDENSIGVACIPYVAESLSYAIKIREPLNILGELAEAGKKGDALAHYALTYLRGIPAPDLPSPNDRNFWMNCQGDLEDNPTNNKKIKKRNEARIKLGRCVSATEDYFFHMREAFRLGLPRDSLLMALEDLAGKQVDPDLLKTGGIPAGSNFEKYKFLSSLWDWDSGCPEQTEACRFWLAKAANLGDVEAMLSLIDPDRERMSRDELRQCWTWMHLSKLLGEDLSVNDTYAINDNGDPYEEGVDGNCYLGGREGIRLDPLPPELDSAAKLEAQKLFEDIQQAKKWRCDPDAQDDSFTFTPCRA